MLEDFIINAIMLIAFVSVTFQVFSRSDGIASLKLKFKIISGVILGCLGIGLMTFGIHLPNELVVDLRNLPLFLSMVSGGWISASISALIMIGYRLMVYGLTQTSIIATIILFLLLLLYSFITQLHIQTKWKWIICILVSQLVTSNAFFILIDNHKLRYEAVVSYCITLSVMSFFLYFYFIYIENFTKSFIDYKHEAKKDFLTGLNNVRHFDSLYNSIIEHARTGDEFISILYIDVDFFKNINDTYGHKEGDLVLQTLSRILKNSCRDIDVISRNGGEEFSVILIGCTPVRTLEIAERIRSNVEATPIQLSNNLTIRITVSIGVACYPDPIPNLEVLREKADMALYEAKHIGRNKVVFSS